MVSELKDKWLWVLLAISGIVIFATLKPVFWKIPCSKQAELKEKPAEQKPTVFKDLKPPDNFASFHVPEGEHKFEVPLKEYGWSGKIFIPPGHYWTVDADSAEMIFPTGKIICIRPGTAVDLGIHPENSVFKLRGKGIAKIYVQRTQSPR